MLPLRALPTYPRIELTPAVSLPANQPPAFVAAPAVALATETAAVAAVDVVDDIIELARRTCEILKCILLIVKRIKYSTIIVHNYTALGIKEPESLLSMSPASESTSGAS